MEHGESLSPEQVREFRNLRSGLESESQLLDRVDEALRLAVIKDAVHCFSAGMESRDEPKDIVSRIPKPPQTA
jgi:hypothetical protein